jgi:hypothetical protein
MVGINHKYPQTFSYGDKASCEIFFGSLNIGKSNNSAHITIGPDNHDCSIFFCNPIYAVHFLVCHAVESHFRILLDAARYIRPFKPLCSNWMDDYELDSVGWKCRNDVRA